MSVVPQSVRLRAENRNERDDHDWYQEPIWASEALFRAEPFIGDIYDPACGEGNVVTAARNMGFEAFGSDIVDRAAGCFGLLDFLDEAAEPYVSYPVDNICTNPPYRDAERFIDLALKRSRFKVAALVRLAFLEGKRRRALFEQWPLSRVLVFSGRISMPPGGRGIKAKGGSVAFSWLVFAHGHDGPATVGWI